MSLVRLRSQRRAQQRIGVRIAIARWDDQDRRDSDVRGAAGRGAAAILGYNLAQPEGREGLPVSPARQSSLSPRFGRVHAKQERGAGHT